MLNQERIHRLVRFCVVGGTVAVVDFSTVWLLSHFLQPLVSVSIAYFVGVTCHFLLNKFWVFQCRRSDYGRQLMQYLTVVLSTWLTTVTHRPSLPLHGHAQHFDRQAFRSSSSDFGRLCPHAALCLPKIAFPRLRGNGSADGRVGVGVTPRKRIGVAA